MCQRRSLTSVLQAGTVQCLLIFPLSAQFYQQGPKLFAPGDSQLQGTSVAICADGNTVLVGAPNAAGGPATGAVVVFTRTDGRWTQQATLVGTGSGIGGPAQQGTAVALSYDCNTALVGAAGDTDPVQDHAVDHGAAWVFTRSGSQWSQQGAKLVGSGFAGSSQQGTSVALSADGSTAVVGGPRDAGTGALWVFTRSNGQWTQQGSKLVGTGAVDSAGLGVSVAISADGNHILAGGSQDNSGTGAAWAFSRSGGQWTQVGSKLIGGSNNSQFGASVALSGDGRIAWVGSPAGGLGGAVWLFEFVNGHWTTQPGQFGQTTVAGSPSGPDAQGTAVGLSYDGSTGIIGAPLRFTSGIPYNQPASGSASGLVWAFDRIGERYVQQGNGYSSALNAALIGAGAVGQAMQGAAVALSADGNTIVAGGPHDNCPVGVPQPANCSAGDPATGAAWIFALAPSSDDFHASTLNAGIWKFVAPAGGNYSLTGSSLVLQLPGGSNHDPAFGGVNQSVRVVQSMPDVDFGAAVRFDSIPTQKYQEEGLVVEQDALNYLRFESYSDGASVKLYASVIRNGAQTIWLDTPVAPAGGSIWLRLNRSGNLWTLSWSSDGHRYDPVANFPAALQVHRVGPYAGNFNSPASAAPAFSAVVGHFYNTTNQPPGDDSLPVQVNAPASPNPPPVAPNLSIRISHDPWLFTLGRQAAYTLTVSNQGGAGVSGAQVVNRLPVQLLPVSMTGAGWQCDLPTLTCTRVPGQDFLAPNASYPPITLTVNVAFQATNGPPSVTNIASVTAGTDADPGNNWAWDFATIFEAGGVFNDSFVQGPLRADLWNFFGDGSYEITNDHLLLTAPGGATHDPVVGGNHSIRLLQAVQDGDIAVEAKFDSLPVTMYQMEGILVEQDASNYLRFEVYSVGTGPRLYVSSIQNGVQTVKLDSAITITGGSVWLRVMHTASDSNWTVNWSTSGTTFNTGLAFNHALTIRNIGPYAANFHPNASTTPAFTAAVDYFVSNSGATPPVQTVRPEDFTYAFSNRLWTFVNPAGGTVDSDGANVSITVPGGSTHDPVVGGNNSARLVQAIANADFGVEVKFNSIPSQLYQMEGFLVEQDAHNYIRFEVYSNGASKRLYAATIINGVQSVKLDTPISINGSSVWIRVIRAGAVYKLLWSNDGTTFAAGVTLTQPFSLQRVGLYAANYASSAGSTPAFTALVDSVAALPCFADGCHTP